MDSSLMLILAMSWYTMFGALDEAYDVSNEASPLATDGPRRLRRARLLGHPGTPQA